MKTAHIKWKEFKADLKKDYFDDTLEYDELEYGALIESCDDRVHPDQWKKLVDHWMTPEAKVRHPHIVTSHRFLLLLLIICII